MSPRIAPTGVVPLLLSEILIVSGSYFFAAYLAIGMDPTFYFIYEGGIKRLLLLLVSFVLAMYFNGLYSRVQARSRIYLIQQLLQVEGIALLAQALVSYAGEDWTVPQNLMLFGCAISLVAVFCWRVFYGAALLKALGAQRVLFLGASAASLEIARELQEDSHRRQTIVAYVDDAHPPGTQLPGGKVLGPIASLRELAADWKPHRIVTGLADRREQLPITDLLELRAAGVKVEEAASAYERVCRRLSAEQAQPTKLIFSRELEGDSDFGAMNILSRAVAAILLILLLPLMLVLALFLGLERGQRVGIRGRHFTLLRFRDPQPGFIGRFCRPFHLDKLPMLFNVVAGHLAFIGPEPDRPEFAHVMGSMIPLYSYRQNVLPGITGWAKINIPDRSLGHDALRRLEYDLYYIKHMSPSLNTYILLHSLKPSPHFQAVP